MSVAYPCQQCQMSFRNSVHINKSQYGYHEFIEPEENSPTRQELLEELYQHVAKLLAQEDELFRVNNPELLDTFQALGEIK